MARAHVHVAAQPHADPDADGARERGVPAGPADPGQTRRGDGRARRPGYVSGRVPLTRRRRSSFRH